MQLTINLNNAAQKPTLTLGNFNGCTALLDTGAMLPMWIKDKDTLEEIGGKTNMKEFKVINTLKIGNNTSIVINDKGLELKNDMQILDENNNSYTILSIGMTNTKGSMENTNILLEGTFTSSKIKI